MSYYVMLMNGNSVAEVEPHLEGITFCDHRKDYEGGIFFGNDKAELSITCNYVNIFRQYFGSKGIFWMYGKKAITTIERLEYIVDQLGTQKDKDPWNPTPGNAGYVLNILLGWARTRPEAVWKILS